MDIVHVQVEVIVLIQVKLAVVVHTVHAMQAKVHLITAIAMVVDILAVMGNANALVV